MAIKKGFETKEGLNIEDAYWRVTRFGIDLKANSAWAILSPYASQDARVAGKEPLISEQVELTFSGETFTDHFSTAALLTDDTTYLSAAYNQFKGLEIFTGAVDV